ncbi:MAG TPA: hypothetical protein VM345_14660 [Acidimicrobiales bacterium]|jgi:hypothetical protein|nr:hypothetical protein [Acidimicrobiales bacterium]
MTTLQTEFTADELLSDHDTTEPLFAGGVRCHGGFDGEGQYVSPRTKFRVPGIQAWQEKHKEEFGKDVIDIPLETWPEHYPNLPQAQYLIEAKVPEPLIATLTRIGTVEGFGANIRYLQPGNMQKHFDESIQGTAIAHLGNGLFEAHGRDEAGWEEEAGHKDMWFAARDIAFENPTSKIDVDGMLQRMGFGGQAAGPNGQPARLLPDDIDPNLEAIASLMTRVLFIEIQAFHTFKWSEAWLSDPKLVAGDGEAARLVSYIRADETPHVGYLKTALTEMRDRTWIGSSGKKYEGSEMIQRIWDRALDNSIGSGRDTNRRVTYGEVEHWAMKRPNGKEILERFNELATIDVHGNAAPEGDGRAAAPATY